MVLSKTHAGTPAPVLRDAVATDTGYDNSPGSDQSPICVLLVHRFEVRIISGGLVELVGPSMDDWVPIEFVHGGHDAVLEFLFGFDTDVAQH